MTAKDLSPTSLVGYVKLFLVLVCFTAVVFNYVSLAKVAFIMSALGQVLSGLGLIKAQDAVPPQPDGLERKQ